jgi:hypothetical protein
MSCSICLNNEIELDYITPCKHRFHKKCINVWFESLQYRDKTCPQCRYVIDTPTIIIIETENPQPIVPKNHRYIFITATMLDVIFLYYYHQWKFSHQLLLMFIVSNMFLICLFRFGVLRC